MEADRKKTGPKCRKARKKNMDWVKAEVENEADLRTSIPGILQLTWCTGGVVHSRMHTEQ